MLEGNPSNPESGHASIGRLPGTRSPERASVSGLSLYSGAMRRPLTLIAIAVLFFGFLAAAAIYITAEDEPEPSTSYVVVIDPTMTKTYVRELERFGGKALGVTVAWIAIAVAALLFWISGRSASR